MGRMVRTAKGDLVDFDAIMIKQQLAEAPMNIEVARRKNLIEDREDVGRRRRTTTEVTDSAVPEVDAEETTTETK